MPVEGAEFPKEISDFEYRKTFGLTQEEFEREPLESYLINSFILTTIAKIEAKQAETARLKARGSMRAT